MLTLAAAAWSLRLAQPAAQPTAGPSKRALLVGIDRYRHMPDLAGSVNDVRAMREVLVGKFDFPPGQIRLLTDEAATRRGIVDALRRLASEAGKGDVVVFHYSGHGSRMPDVSGDEIDGLDETLVPHDGRGAGVFDLSDDEVNGLLRALSRKTRNVSFILDACHSGSGVRRIGARARVVPDDDRPPPAAPPFALGGPGAVDGAHDFRREDAGYVLISGCRASELSNEMPVGERMHGALTHFLARALLQAGKRTTYRDVMDAVRTDVTAAFPSQHPQLEGGRADAPVFGDDKILARPYVLASPRRGGGVELEAGTVYGLAPGARLQIYPSGAKAFALPARPLAAVELIKVEAFRSSGRIVAGGPVPPLARAVLHTAVHPDDRLRVALPGLGSSPTLRRILGKLDDDPALAVVEKSARAQVMLAEKDGAIVLTAADLGDLAAPVPVADPDVVAGVLRLVQGWARWFRVLGIDNPDSTLDVHVSVGLPGAGAGDPSELRVTAGQQVAVHVENRSDEHLFVAILDLASDGSVTVLFPRPGRQEELPPKASLRRTIEMFVPPGRRSSADIVKVFATTAPIEPRVFEQGKVRGDLAPGASSNPLARFLEDAVLGVARNRRVALDRWVTAERRILVETEAHRLESRAQRPRRRRVPGQLRSRQGQR